MLKYLINIVKRFFNRFENQNIRRQLILSYIPISLVILLIFAVISYNLSSYIVSENSKSFINETMGLLSNDIDKKLSEFENVTSKLVMDYDIYNVLSNNGSDLEYYSKYDKIKQNLNYITDNLSDIRSIFIYPMSQPIIIKSNSNINFNDLNYKNTELFKNIINDSTKKFWSISALGVNNQPDGEYLYLMRAIPNIANNAIGIIQIQIFEDSIFRIYKDISFCKGSLIFITDKDGVVISHPDKDIISKKAYPLLSKMVDGKSGSFTTTIDEKKYLVIYRTIESNSWKLITIIPVNFMESENSRILYTSLIMMLLSSAFIILISMLISSGIAKPLEKVDKAMECIEKGHFDMKLDFNNSNEIGKISRRYNTMAAEIKKLMELIRMEEKKKKEAYIQVLQSQIKPHFLYNTLFTIKCLASMNNQEQIENLLGSLINLLMASINKGGEFIKIREEIEYVKNYALIQSYRFGEKLKIIYDIEPKVQECIILKLLIQPIVENSILHGFEGANKEFQIKIIGRIEKNDVVLRIIDNGRGMEDETIKALFQSEGKDGHKNVFSGIGIKNVDERIKLHFGDNYGLYYTSKLNKGTEAIIRLPIIKDVGGM